MSVLQLYCRYLWRRVGFNIQGICLSGNALDTKFMTGKTFKKLIVEAGLSCNKNTNNGLLLSDIQLIFMKIANINTYSNDNINSSSDEKM